MTPIERRPEAASLSDECVPERRLALGTGFAIHGLSALACLRTFGERRARVKTIVGSDRVWMSAARPKDRQ
jgi:hypothetical protein